MLETSIDYHIIPPPASLAPYVKFFWHLRNQTDLDKEVIILPDGYFDIIYYALGDAPFDVLLVGLSTQPATYTIPAGSVSFAISFKLPAAEHILKIKMADLLNKKSELKKNYWNLDRNYLPDFRSFASYVSDQLKEQLLPEKDRRKQQLFEMVYNRAGLVTVEEVANTVHWNARQINRYFNQWFGINLKKYCTILRYRASFKDIKDGKLFPEEHYTDQAHFIREIKKFSSVTPKELRRNKNDRFIQFSTLSD